MERASSAMASLLLTVNALNECKNVFGLPYGSAGAKLDGFGVAPRLAASPPRAFADRDKSQHLRKAKKTGFGDGGKHVNAPFADGTKKCAPRTLGQRSAWACCKRSAGLAKNCKYLTISPGKCPAIQRKGNMARRGHGIYCLFPPVDKNVLMNS